MFLAMANGEEIRQYFCFVAASRAEKMVTSDVMQIALIQRRA